MRLRLVCALTLSVVSVGCSFDRRGTADDNPLVDATDTGIDDTSHDVIATDVATPDAEDVSDAVAEADSELDAPDTSVTGILAATVAPATALAVDLTAEGVIAWAHWGLLTEATFTRKAGVGGITNGTGPTPLRWDKFPVAFTWSDGDPNSVASATATGVYRTTTTDAFEFEVGAGTTTRTLRLYTATHTATATASFALSDSSATSAVVALPGVGTEPGAAHRPQVITVTFRSTSPTAKLTARLVKTSTTGFAVSLFAATVQ